VIIAYDGSYGDGGGSEHEVLYVFFDGGQWCLKTKETHFTFDCIDVVENSPVSVCVNDNDLDGLVNKLHDLRRECFSSGIDFLVKEVVIGEFSGETH